MTGGEENVISVKILDITGKLRDEDGKEYMEMVMEIQDEERKGEIVCRRTYVTKEEESQ